MEVAAPLWELGLVPDLSHLGLPGQHLRSAGGVFQTSLTKMRLFWAELKEEEKVGECRGQWSMS